MTVTSKPVWGPVGSYTADFLALIADEWKTTPGAAREWVHFLHVLEAAALANDGIIRFNRIRDRLREEVAPHRVGAFTRRALCAGLIAYTGKWEDSDDVTSRNRGKPCREIRWIGGDQ